MFAIGGRALGEVLSIGRDRRVVLRLACVAVCGVALAVWCGGWLMTAAAQESRPSPAASASAAVSAPTDHYYDVLPQDSGEAGLKLTIRKLETTGRLMQVTAHPDDEDGGMLTLEARGKGVATVLMTLTRGEGGQNKLGSNLFDVLGVLRTQELLASDRYYGIEQRFSSVADFGYSKTPEETFQKWQGHDRALGDMVRVIRTFRPDVLIARFSGTDRDGHGHHQASAMLTKEAFRAAGDAKKFPEQIEEGLQPWQAKKLYIGNVCGFGAATCDGANYTVRLNTGTSDAALGTSYIQLAMKGLRHQLSQGAANWSVEPGDRFTFYKLADAVVESPSDKDGHEKDFFDGIDTTLSGLAARLGDEERKVPWLRAELAGAESEIKQAAEKAESSDPMAAGEPLSKAADRIGKAIRRLKDSEGSDGAKEAVLAALEEKQEQAELGAGIAFNVRLEATVAAQGDPKAVPAFKDALTVVSPGQSLQVNARVYNGSGRWVEVKEAEIEAPEGWVRHSDAGAMTLEPGQNYHANFGLKVPADTAMTRPYWHRDNPETDALNTIDEERYRTLPFPPPPLRIRVKYEVVPKRSRSPVPDVIRDRKKKKEPGTRELSAVVYVPFLDDGGHRDRAPIAVAPVFSLTLEPGEQVLPVSDEKEITVRVGVSSNLTGAPTGTLRLELPRGWKSEPERLPVTLGKRGDKQDFSFKVLPTNLHEGRVEIRAVLEAADKKYSEGYSLVTREDLGSAHYYQPAQQRVSIVDVKLPSHLKLGYIMGAGDEIPTVLEQIGMDVAVIPAEKLPATDLSAYSTIVLGIRAYDTQKDVITNNKKLLAYVEAGGRLVVQYNTLGYTPAAGDFNSGKFTPYPATLSRARVSVEDAPVKMLDPGNEIFHYPNEITAADFEGWVQERGLYFMSQWDPQFTPLLECHDPGESEQKGGLLVAHYGKGMYIYTSYAFFRQLPAGVPGAVRLFVNLVSGM